MVKISVIAGFLGVGKTSLIIEIGKTLSTVYGKKVAILVNEIGEVGVDGKYIEDYGFATKEITEGCICCSLSQGLVNTITTLSKQFRPEVILIEPTGVALPSKIRQILRRLKLKEGVEMVPVITLVDGSRFSKLFQEMKQFSMRQIEDADIIAINKKDLIGSKQMLSVIESSVQQLNPKATVLSISAKKVEGVRELAEIILKSEIVKDVKILEEQEAYIDSEEQEAYIDSKSLATMGSYGLEIDFTGGTEKIDFEYIKEVLETIGKRAKEVGAEEIGHIKASIKTPEGTMKISLLDLKSDLEVSGEKLKEFHGGEMSLLAVIKGIKDNQLEKIVEETVSEIFNAKNITFEIKEHHHQ